MKKLAFRIWCCFFFIQCFAHAQKSKYQPAPVFHNVRDYGARGDGKQLDNKAIDRAIIACDKAGGGTVFLLMPGQLYWVRHRS